MKQYRVYQVDAFTRDLFSGNPAGVVSNAEGLSTEQMQAIARELNNSETAFLLPADDSSHEVKIRFFTPTTEVPSCGHATVSAHYVRAIEQKLESSTIIQKIGSGILPVKVEKLDSDYSVTVTQGKIEFTEAFSDEITIRILFALGLSSEDQDKRCPLQIVSTGHSKVMIGIKSKDVLNSLNPNVQELIALSSEIGCNGYFVFCFNPKNDSCLISGRMFAPAIGISEDPVTGNANGPLGAYIVKHKLCEIPADNFRFLARQGEAMGRPGVIEVQVSIEEENPIEVRITGSAVIAFKTEIEL